LQLSGQSEHKISIYAKMEGNYILYDQAMGNSPGLTYFLEKKQRISVALSLTHIFEADHTDDGPFGYAGLGLNFRVF
jgi:hypothetical protein